MIQTACGLFGPYGRRSAVCAAAAAFELIVVLIQPLAPYTKAPLCEVFVCVVPRGGIEPPTRGFSAVCVTDPLFNSISYRHENRVC